MPSDDRVPGDDLMPNADRPQPVWPTTSRSAGEEPPALEITSDGDLIHLRESDAPDTVVTTSKAKLRAFLLGVKAGEFDHLV
ncbi:DUF397 domain-containing protein [Kitasatospora sp. NPDC048239]|uniref:DUF397 domain-containing protein n=1 Tax=Kitasatospora sp. NPDC048239 TaxID=3364046 RepID=UPI003720BB23